MIRIAFDQAVCLYVFVLIAIAGGAWLVMIFSCPAKHGADTPGGRAGAGPQLLFRQCPYCSHVCEGLEEREIMVCPGCKSYLEEGQV